MINNVMNEHKKTGNWQIVQLGSRKNINLKR